MLERFKIPSINDIEFVNGFPQITHQEFTEAGVRFGKVLTDREHIVCLGCSNTYGYEMNEDDSWPSMLQGIVSDNFQVLNMGRMGYGFQLLVDWYHHHSENLNVKTVVIQLPHFSRQPYPGIQSDERIHYTAFYGSIYLTDFVRDLGFDCLDNHPLIKRSEFLETADFLVLCEVERFKAFAGYLLGLDIEVVVVPYLVPYWSVMKTDVIKYFKAIRNVCNQREIKILDDISDLFMRKNGMTSDFTHPNRKGNQYIVDKIYQKMFTKNSYSDAVAVGSN